MSDSEKKELDQPKAEGGAVRNEQAVKQQAQLEMVDLARAFYNTLPPSKIVLQNGYKFTPDIDTFIRNGATFCHNLTIERGLDDRAFSGQPPEFFDKLIKHFHKTENTEEMVASLDIALARNNPAAWPASLVLLHGADIGLISKEQLDKDEVPILAEEKVFHDERKVVYSMRNKNKPMVGFKLSIHFEGEAKCYRQMTRFAAERIDVQLDTNNFPAELKVEIVDLFPLENAVLFLSNVPNRLIINKCAPQVRGILRTIRQIATDYARTLPAPNSDGDIHLGNGHEYKPDMDIFLRYGAAHCGGFFIWHGTSDGFVGYPDNFFNDLIKYYYETKAPGNAVFYLEFQLSLTNPAPWPAALVQPQAGEMNVKVELEVKDQCETYVEYNLHNKHDSDDVFKLFIYFQEGAQCYQHMTRFAMWREGWYDS